MLLPAPKNKMDLSIIIPTFERASIANETFKTICNIIENKNIELIIVNDSKRQQVSFSYQTNNLLIVNNPGSGGAASARNYGASMARSELLLFVDDDILITEQSIDRAFELNKQYPNSCFNLNWTYPETLISNMKTHQLGRFILKCGLTNYKSWATNINWKNNELFSAPILSTFFLLIPKSVFEKFNGFNETFKNQGVEDDEFTSRLNKGGIQLYIDSNFYVYHNESDKMNVDLRLKRINIGAFNKRFAYDNGAKEYFIKYSALKYFFYTISSPFYFILLKILKLIPNYIFFDFLFFKLFNLLIGVVIFKGYNKKQLI